ncbi:MAG: hypothetical protein AAGH15_05805 [Myxococcota bacterium]
MILELSVGAGLVAAAAYAFRALKRSGELEDREEPDESPPKTPEPDAPPPKPVRTGPRGLRVGDVLLYADDELWLAGCLEVWEEGFVARAFATPGSGRAAWVLQLDPAGEELAFGDVTDAVPGGAVPAELPVGGLRLRLKKRGQATVRREGDGLPFASDVAEYILLRGPGGKALLVLDFDTGDRLAILGDGVGRELLELLPGGG